MPPLTDSEGTVNFDEELGKWVEYFELLNTAFGTEDANSFMSNFETRRDNIVQFYDEFLPSLRMASPSDRRLGKLATEVTLASIVNTIQDLLRITDSYFRYSDKRAYDELFILPQLPSTALQDSNAEWQRAWKSTDSQGPTAIGESDQGFHAFTEHPEHEDAAISCTTSIVSGTTPSPSLDSQTDSGYRKDDHVACPAFANHKRGHKARK